MRLAKFGKRIGKRVTLKTLTAGIITQRKPRMVTQPNGVNGKSLKKEITW